MHHSAVLKCPQFEASINGRTQHHTSNPNLCKLSPVSAIVFYGSEILIEAQFSHVASTANRPIIGWLCSLSFMFPKATSLKLSKRAT